MTPFEDLLQALGERMGIPLRPDAKQCCKLDMGEQFFIQLDLSREADKILMGSTLGTLSPGKYREQIFLKALYTNTSALAPRGLLGFSNRADALVLFQFLEIAHLNGQKLFDFLQTFTEHARLWRDALARGQLPQIEEGVMR